MKSLLTQNTFYLRHRFSHNNHGRSFPRQYHTSVAKPRGWLQWNNSRGKQNIMLRRLKILLYYTKYWKVYFLFFVKELWSNSRGKRSISCDHLNWNYHLVLERVTLAFSCKYFFKFILLSFTGFCFVRSEWHCSGAWSVKVGLWWWDNSFLSLSFLGVTKQ